MMKHFFSTGVFCAIFLTFTTIELLEVYHGSEKGLRNRLGFEDQIMEASGLQEPPNDNCSYPKERMIPSAELPQLIQDEPIAGFVNSLPGTTGVGAPKAIRSSLSKMFNAEEQNADSPTLEQAIRRKQNACGWDSSAYCFKNHGCMNDARFKKSTPKVPESITRLIDVVVVSSDHLDFLDRWREFFQGIHFIILQSGDPDKFLQIPKWVDYSLYNRNDIKKMLKAYAWLSPSSDAGLRKFGLLASTKPFIYMLDKECHPAARSDGYYINPLRLHLRNLLTPSIPYYVNTLYDPYVAGSDFVRGYPYSLRQGAITAVSHGLWLDSPDYDAPTTILKMAERNNRLLDTTMTVPYATFYSMSLMNVALSRELIGPAFMPGLMENEKLLNSDNDVVAGWAAKVVADHLGLGMKSGQPYVSRRKRSNPFEQLQNDFEGQLWQEEVLRFFANEVTIPTAAADAMSAYRALALQLETKFKQRYPQVEQIARAMIVWSDLWKNVTAGKVKFVPSRKTPRLVSSTFQELSFGETSWARNVLLSNPHYKILFETFGVPPNVKAVTNGDVEVGTSWKTYILPLSARFHRDPFIRFAKFGCLLNACNRSELDQLPFSYEDHEAEVIILRKMLSALRFTDDVSEADMILVPALPVTIVNTRWYNKPNPKGCRSGAECENSWFKDLFKEVEALKHSSNLKPHVKFVYTSSIDSAIMHQSYLKLLRDKDSIVLTYGSSGLVIPSLNTNLELQPGHRQESTHLDERDVFVFANFGVRHPIRRAAYEQLRRYNGKKKIVMEKPGGRYKRNPHLLDDARRSIFILCLPGDFPFQKRFYDALAHGVIPVVARIPLKGGHFSHFYVNKVVKHFFGPGRDVSTPTVANTYPPWKEVLGISVQDLVVEVDIERFFNGTMMEYLESIPDSVISTKLNNIERVRNYAVYNFEGSAPDAFSVILKSLARMIH